MTTNIHSLMRPVFRVTAALVLALLIFTTVPLASHAAFGGQGSDTVEDIKQDASNLLSSIGSYGVQQRKQAVAAMSDAVDQLDRQADSVKEALESGWTEMNAASRRQAEKTLKEIDQQRSKVVDLLDQVRRSPDDAWDSAKQQFVDATSGLLQAIESAGA